MNNPTNSNKCARKKSAEDEVSCKNCSLINMLALLEGDADAAPELSERILTKKRPCAIGEILFQANQPFTSVYAIKSGAAKSYCTLGDRQQIIGFHLPGELLGLDAVGTTYRSTAEMVENGSVCELGFDNLALLNQQYPAFQEQLIKLTSQQILVEQRQSLLSSRRSAEERLAAFILDYSDRLIARGFNGDHFRLVMTRQDIADYLGLAEATVSRAIQRFKRSDLLKVSGKNVDILDRKGLEKAAIDGL
ncbi:MAG: helix-turn-helix domain-containing protein [Candidatus Polarisedimenticolaceae bacterium]|nr:helix-turn-helix domain-containing protein [Candidatus Polarisedimenticolaceae bacterium]